MPLPPGAGPGSGTGTSPRPGADLPAERGPGPDPGEPGAGPAPGETAAPGDLGGPGDRAAPDEESAPAGSQVKGRPDWLRVRHAAIIMDGNGRWAQQQDLPRLEGHRRGARSVREVVRAARELGLPALTLYAFSEQNWERPLDEVQGLMQLLHDYVLEERAEILDNGIRLRAIGNILRLPDFVKRPLQQLIADSAHGAAMTLTLALSYGGRESILEAVRAVAEKVRAGVLRPEQIDEAALTDCFQTSELPPVDLIIRTSGELRTSNFLLWESTHAEFYTTPALWPEFTRAELLTALRSVSASRAAGPSSVPGAGADGGEPGDNGE
ncbi:MAG TPA: polyprenyl diphosphate synthase [Pseudomonadota bacterium]|nr:polyprenyl diphosphate synthase [Pseudomonadota bacterium]